MAPAALIVVLGDLGRSPRMVNHARALLARGWHVALAGYDENPLPAELRENPAVSVVPLRPGGRALLRLAQAISSRCWTAILIQNPPGFPALAVAALLAPPGARLALDWHNLGGTLLALRATARRRWAWLYSWCEGLASAAADDHWAVSAALARAVRRGGASVIYDQPSQSFCAAAVSSEDRSVWWRRILPGQPVPSAQLWVAAPSSWGPDEDHGALLGAARSAQQNRDHWNALPSIAIIATGKGPGQAEFARAAMEFADGPIALRTAWIPAEAYPAFLGHADLGVCLHRSSSGLDLPMKLADFRGAGLPALVCDYGPVLEEILARDATTRRFVGSVQLAQALREFSSGAVPRRCAVAAPKTWEAEWDRRLGAWADEQLLAPAIL